MVIAEAQRTLVKSPPELWSELSDPAALARHLAELGEIRIVRTDPEQSVEWESEDKRGRVEIQPSGWGTKVTLSVTIESDRSPADDAPAAGPAAGSIPSIALSSDPKPTGSVEPPPPEPAPHPTQSSPQLERAPTDPARAQEAAPPPAEPMPAAHTPHEVDAADAAPSELMEASSEPAGPAEQDPQAARGAGSPSRGLFWRIRRLGRALRGEARAEKGERATDPAGGLQRTLGTPQTAAAVAEPCSAGGPAGRPSDGAHSACASRATAAGPDASASRATGRELHAAASRATSPRPELGAERSPSSSREKGENGITKPSPTPSVGQDNGSATEPSWSRAREEPPNPPSDPGSRARVEHEDPGSEQPGSRARSNGPKDADQQQVARTTELLSAMLDSLGEAHHRPFSRA